MNTSTHQTLSNPSDAAAKRTSLAVVAMLAIAFGYMVGKDIALKENAKDCIAAGLNVDCSDRVSR